MARVIAEQIRCLTDGRGLLFEPISAHDIQRQKNVHIVLTEPGHIRGNHIHSVGIETAVIMGDALVRIDDHGKITDYIVHSDEVWRFIIPPGVAHAFKSLGPKPMLLVGFNTEPHDPQRPDVQRRDLITT